MAEFVFLFFCEAKLRSSRGRVAAGVACMSLTIHFRTLCVVGNYCKGMVNVWYPSDPSNFPMRANFRTSSLHEDHGTDP